MPSESGVYPQPIQDIDSRPLAFGKLAGYSPDAPTSRQCRYSRRLSLPLSPIFIYLKGGSLLSMSAGSSLATVTGLNTGIESASDESRLGVLRRLHEFKNSFTVGLTIGDNRATRGEMA